MKSLNVHAILIISLFYFPALSQSGSFQNFRLENNSKINFTDFSIQFSNNNFSENSTFIFQKNLTIPDFQSGNILSTIPSFINGEGNAINDIQQLKPYRFGLYVNPLGFLEFGPIVGSEFTLFSRLIIDAHVRFSTYGLLMPLISKNGDGITPYELEGMGAGGGLKFLFATDNGGLYLGIITEKGWQEQYYEEGEPWENKTEVEYVAVVSNIGYKFASHSGFYFNLGAYIGAAITTKNEWYYLHNYNGDSSVHTSDPATRPFIMIEACLGFDFLKF